MLEATAASASNDPLAKLSALEPAAAVTGGPRWYRARIRLLGPLLALSFPLALWLFEWAGRQLLSGKLRIGWYVGLQSCAAPGLLVVGFPLSRSSTRPIGIAISVLIWLVLGVASARVTTRNPMASFRDFWRTYAWFAAAVIAGVVLALIGFTIVSDLSLLDTI